MIEKPRTGQKVICKLGKRIDKAVIVGLTVFSMKYLPFRGFFIFILTNHSWDTKREISFKRQKKKDHQKLCPLVNNDRQKRGTLTMSQLNVLLRKDGCNNLAYAILTRAVTKARMLTQISPQQHRFLRSVSDDVVSMTSAKEFQGFCSCSSEIHLFWWWLSGEKPLLQPIWTQVQSL